MDEWEGLLSHPNGCLEMRVRRYGSTVEVTYTGTKALIRAALVTPDMERKIALQKRGSKTNSAGVKFRLSCPQAEWLAGVDGEMQIFFVSSDEPSLMELPGMRCRFPHGLPSGGVSRKVAAPRTRYRTVGRLARNVEWFVVGDVIFPNWMLVAAEVLNRKYNPAT